MTTRVHPTACSDIQTRLFELHALLDTWEAVALELGVSSGMAWRAAYEGYEPKDPEIRKRLGFPQIVFQTVYRNPNGTFKPKPNRKI